MAKSLYALVLAGILALVSGYLMADRKNVSRKTVATINAETEKKNAKARKAKSLARAPGAVDRLRKSDCRDCQL